MHYCGVFRVEKIKEDRVDYEIKVEERYKFIWKKDMKWNKIVTNSNNAKRN